MGVVEPPAVGARDEGGAAAFTSIQRPGVGSPGQAGGWAAGAAALGGALRAAAEERLERLEKHAALAAA
jgi:hypothetical protein